MCKTFTSFSRSSTSSFAFGNASLPGPFFSFPSANILNWCKIVNSGYLLQAGKGDVRRSGFKTEIGSNGNAQSPGNDELSILFRITINCFGLKVSRSLIARSGDPLCYC